MSTDGARPQPRFRIWDEIEWFDYPDNRRMVIEGVKWIDALSRFGYMGWDDHREYPMWIAEHDTVKLIHRPGLEPALPVETLRQKADRLKREYERCDDKSWLDKKLQAEKAEQSARETTGCTVSFESLADLVQASRQLAQVVEGLQQRIGTGRAAKGADNRE